MSSRTLFLVPLAVAVLAAVALALLASRQADIASLLLLAGPWQR